MAHPTPDVLALLSLGEDADQPALDHVGSCHLCTDEVHALQQVVAVGRSLGPEDRIVAPHPRVWARIATDVNDGRVIPLPSALGLRHEPVVPPAAPAPVPLGGVEGDGPTDRADERGDGDGHQGGGQGGDGRRPPLRRRSVAALAAAAALVAGTGGFALRGLLDPAPEVLGSVQLNALPSWAGANGNAKVEQDPDGQRTLVIAMQMPADRRVDGRLDVWMSDSWADDMIRMGPMTGLSSRFPIPDGVDIGSHPIVDISLEPPGDTDAAHSSVSVLRGRLPL